MRNVHKEIFKKQLFKKKFFLIINILLVLTLLFSNSFVVRADISSQTNSQINIAKKLANKYCQSIEKKLFEGLDTEFTLKYKYFFSSISKDSIQNVERLMQDFISQVNLICSHKLTKSDIKEFNNYFRKFYSDKINY
tara:strand:- start:73 stop:483 length:411 start_codon:yes stop_codon:yes gene_type:complete